MVEQSDSVDKQLRGWKSTSRDIELTQISFTGVQGISCAFHARFQLFRAQICFCSLTQSH